MQNTLMKAKYIIILLSSTSSMKEHMESCLKRILEFCIIKDDIIYSIWTVVQMT